MFFFKFFFTNSNSSRYTGRSAYNFKAAFIDNVYNISVLCFT